MATYSATVSSPRSADDVFAYLADFRCVTEWDPSMKESTLLGAGDPVMVGARFHIVASTTAKDVEIEYETVELERPRRIALRGENDTMVAMDTITIADRPGGGCDVTYDVDIDLKGARKLADPLFSVGLKRMSDKARDGLAEKLATG